MDWIIEEIYDLPRTYKFLAILAISLAIHIISLKMVS